MLTYNDKMKHSATGMTPNQARKEKHEFRAMINVASKAKKEHFYPELFVGDKVKIMRKNDYWKRKNFPLAERLLCCARDCRKVEPQILQINWLPKIVDEAWTFKDLVFLESLVSSFISYSCLLDATMRWLIWCAVLVSGFCVLPFICFPHKFAFGKFGSLAGIAPCSFALPRLGFVIHLFFILLSGRSAFGNMSVGDLKPHVLGELDLGICFNLSTFDILNWKTTEISSFSLRLELCVILQHLLLKPLGHAFKLRGVGMFMAQIRVVACLIILALSAATDTNSTVNVNAWQENVSWKKSGQVRGSRAVGEEFLAHHASGVRISVLCVAVETVITFFMPVARQFWRRRFATTKVHEKACFANRAKQNSALSRSFAIENVCMHSEPSQAQHPVHSCLIQRQTLPKTWEDWHQQVWTHTTQIFFTPFRPKSLDCCAIYIALRLRRHGHQQVHEGWFGHGNCGLKEIWDWERCDAVVIC